MPYVQYPNGEVFKVENPEDFSGAVRISEKTGKALVMEQAREDLKNVCPEGSKVYIVLRTVAKSGMSRTVSLFVTRDGEIVDITGYAAHALGWPLRNVRGSRAMRVDGCGMDMGCYAVFCLGRALYGDDYALKHSWL